MRKLSIAAAVTCALTFALSPLAAVAQDTRPADSAAEAPTTVPEKPVDVLELRQQLAQSLAAEGERLLAAGDAAAAARKFREAAGLAIETPTSPEAARAAKRQAVIDRYAAGLRADAKRLQKDGKMSDAYRHAVEALQIEPLDEAAREVAVACQPAAVAEWKAAWAKFLGGRPLQVSLEQIAAEPPADASPADQAVYKALRQTVPKMFFSGSKIEDVLQFIRDVTKANIHVKWWALEEVGIMPDTPVDLKLTEVTLETALKILLDNVSGAVAHDDRLSYIVREGVLRISTNQALDTETFRHAYDIRDLLEPAGPADLPAIPPYDARPWQDGGAWLDVPRNRLASAVIRVLEKAVEPESWIEGSPTSSSATYIAGSLAINQTARNHDQVGRVLRLMRWARAPSAEAARSLAAPAANSPEAKAARLLREKLDAVVPQLTFRNTKLEDVVEFLRDLTRCSIQVNWRAMEEAGITKDRPVNLQLRQVTLRTALDVLLDDVSGAVSRSDRLNTIERDGVLMISTSQDLDRETCVLAYDVRDLLVQEAAEEVLAEGDPIETLFRSEDWRYSGGGEDREFIEDGCRSARPSDPLQWAANNLIEVLQHTIDPESWIEGTPTSGSITSVDGVLIIRQTPRNHRQIAELLANLRKPLLAKAAEGRQ